MLKYPINHKKKMRWETLKVEQICMRMRFLGLERVSIDLPWCMLPTNLLFTHTRFSNNRLLLSFTTRRPHIKWWIDEKKIFGNHYSLIYHFKYSLFNQWRNWSLLYVIELKLTTLSHVFLFQSKLIRLVLKKEREIIESLKFLGS